MIEGVVQGLSGRYYEADYISSLHGDPVWEAIWDTIKRWDISRHPDALYHGPTGDDVTAIYEAVRRAIDNQAASSA